MISFYRLLALLRFIDAGAEYLGGQANPAICGHPKTGHLIP
jgi:hypothetical protein